MRLSNTQMALQNRGVNICMPERERGFLKELFPWLTQNLTEGDLVTIIGTLSPMQFQKEKHTLHPHGIEVIHHLYYQCGVLPRFIIVGNAPKKNAASIPNVMKVEEKVTFWKELCDGYAKDAVTIKTKPIRPSTFYKILCEFQSFINDGRRNYKRIVTLFMMSGESKGYYEPIKEAGDNGVDAIVLLMRWVDFGHFKLDQISTK